jgi:hypothetical protein
LTGENNNPYFDIRVTLVDKCFFKKDIQSEYFLPSKAQSCFITDYNHDGFNDILVAHQSDFNTPGLTIMKNIYWGNFEISDTTKIFNAGSGDVLCIDVNNDGWNDIVTFRLDTISGVLYHYLRVYYNDNGTFPGNNFTDFNLQSTATFDGLNYGDINGDGYIDLVVYSLNYGFWDVLYNNGQGGFQSPTRYNIPEPAAIFCADLDGDGRDDVIVVGGSTRIYWSYTYGFHTFVLDNSYMQFGAVVDFDGDGKKDILIDNGFYMMRFYRNMGNKTFQQLPDLIFPSGCGPFKVSDFNNDGLPDLIFSGRYLHEIWYNQGAFQISDEQFIAIPDYGAYTVTVSCGDLDNNGFNDIISVRSLVLAHPAVDIRFNDGHGNFLPDPIVGIRDMRSEQKGSLLCFPNPFQTETEIEFTIQVNAFVEITLFDIEGKKINSLIKQKMKGGSHFVKWRGLDNGGKPCKPGAYFAYLLENGKISQVSKIVKL